MLQLLSEQPNKAVFSDGPVGGQIFFEEFSGHEKSVRKYWGNVQTYKAVTDRIRCFSLINMGFSRQ